MRTEEGKRLRYTKAERVMVDKHRQQIDQHEKRFGKLGELQTKKQKASLARALEGRGN